MIHFFIDTDDEDVFDFYTWLLDSDEAFLTDHDLALCGTRSRLAKDEPAVPDVPF